MVQHNRQISQTEALLNTTRDSIRREESRKRNIESNPNSPTYTQDLDNVNQALQGLYRIQADCVALLQELSYQLGCYLQLQENRENKS